MTLSLRYSNKADSTDAQNFMLEPFTNASSLFEECRFPELCPIMM